MAKFVSDLKTQLPADKVLATDENSVIKTLDVTRQQLQDLIDDSIIVDKYSDLPSIAKDGANGFVKNDELIGTRISEFTEGMSTDIYIVPNPSLEGITLPELGERPVYAESLVAEDYVVQFVYGNVVNKLSNGVVILVSTTKLVTNYNINYLYNLSPSTTIISDGSTLDIGWYTCDALFENFESVKNYSEIPYALNIELPKVQSLDSYVAYENSILCKFLASSVQNNVKGHYKYENENWVYNEEELTVDTYNQLPTNSIEENQLSFVKNSTSEEYVKMKINANPFSLDTVYSDFQFMETPDLSSVDSSGGYVGTLDLNTRYFNNGFTFGTRALTDANSNSVNAFVIQKFTYDSSCSYGAYPYVKDGSNKTYEYYIYVNSACNLYIDDIDKDRYSLDAMQLFAGWNNVIITINTAENTSSVSSGSISHKDMMTNIKAVTTNKFYITEVEVSFNSINPDISSNTIVSYSDNGRGAVYLAASTATGTGFNKYIQLIYKYGYYKPAGHYNYIEGQWISISTKNKTTGVLSLNDYTELPKLAEEGQAAYLAKPGIEVIDNDIASTAKVSIDEYTSIYLPETLSIDISTIPVDSDGNYSESISINSENGLYNLLFQYNSSSGPILGIVNSNTYKGNMYIFKETSSDLYPHDTIGWHEYITGKYIEDTTKLIQPGISYIVSYNSSSTDGTIQDSIILKLLVKQINLYRSGHYVYSNNSWIFTDNIINERISPTANSLFLAPVSVRGSNVDADDICIFTLMNDQYEAEVRDTAAVTSYNIPIAVSSLLSAVTSWEDYEQFDANIKHKFSYNRWLIPTSQLVKFRVPDSGREVIQSLSIDCGTAGNVILMFDEVMSWKSLRSNYGIQDPQFAPSDEGSRIPNGIVPELALVSTIIVHDSRNGVSYSIDYTLSAELFTPPEYTILHNTPILEAEIGNINTILTRLNSGEGV